MTAIQVARLTLRCPVQDAPRLRFAIEDGLHTAIPDDRRLVLVRRMQLPGEVSAAHPARRQDAVRAGWLAAIANARHGADDDAADANCVWFASRDEAEMILLARMLKGRGAEAWYWRLALPDWRGQKLRDWVSNSLSEAVAGGQDRRLLAIARCFVAAGAVDQLVEAISGLLAAPRGAGSALSTTKNSPLPVPSPRLAVAEVSGKAAAAFAQSIARELGGIVTQLVRAGGEAPAVARAIVRAWIFKRSPALALSPELAPATLAATMDALVALPRRPPPSMAPAAAETRRHRPISTSRIKVPVPVNDGLPATRKCRPPARRRNVAIERMNPLLEPNADSEEVEAAWLVPRRLHSAHAGLWLVVPSLIELGVREWLADRPALLGGGPGGQLLREIACHHRVALDDPALIAILPAIDPDFRPEWCRLWRHGLDRWLRRTAGRRLHDLVNRPGQISLGDQSLMIYYPATDADLALRRRALDRDPGWADWLGLSIRYIFGGTEDWL